MFIIAAAIFSFMDTKMLSKVLTLLLLLLF